MRPLGLALILLAVAAAPVRGTACASGPPPPPPVAPPPLCQEPDFTCDPNTGPSPGTYVLPNLPDGLPCDTDACARGRSCLAGVCQGGEARPCVPDQRPQDWPAGAVRACVDFSSGVCAGGGDLFAPQCNYTLLPTGTPCDDRDPCTLEGQSQCTAAGQCQGPAFQCQDPADPCTGVGVCDPDTGACPLPPVDGPACTGGPADTAPGLCAAGVCQPDCSGAPCDSAIQFCAFADAGGGVECRCKQGLTGLLCDTKVATPYAVARGWLRLLASLWIWAVAGAVALAVLLSVAGILLSLRPGARPVVVVNMPESTVPQAGTAAAAAMGAGAQSGPVGAMGVGGAVGALGAQLRAGARGWAGAGVHTGQKGE